ncbi:hypothetical protein CQ064_08690 [Bacillus sp. MYb78]|uniref:Uncharacterized protein n=3 Tax=Bacillus thuringiensis TaxID=1428 RepID=A0A9X6VCL1_BACTU|nr:hypothetical protein bthur0002_58580 [Bacillus thuringiensis Bt407]PFB07980.1 hypothetical protein CN398_09630 [Bacillus thuringiensis]PQZ77917.1 hypothetical protein CQ064_08690 [Bacillus sp. MYb78]
MIFKGDGIMNDATIDWESELRENLLFQLHIHYKFEKIDLRKQTTKDLFYLFYEKWERENKSVKITEGIKMCILAISQKIGWIAETDGELVLNINRSESNEENK